MDYNPVQCAYHCHPGANLLVEVKTPSSPTNILDPDCNRSLGFCQSWGNGKTLMEDGSNPDETEIGYRYPVWECL
ncbi:MAG: hypothetical protein R2784_14265 [Saprospiraceae bacterium]